MHLVVLDKESIELHRNAYSNVTWEIIEHLSNGNNVVINGQDSRKELEIEWCSNYFKQFIDAKNSSNADIIVAHPNQLQVYIESEKEFLSLNGYEIIDGVAHSDSRKNKETQKKQNDELRSIRELCARIFSYDRFLSGKTLKCVKAKLCEYCDVVNDPEWGGKQFFDKLGVKYCLYCNFGNVFWESICRKRNNKQIVSILCFPKST